MIDYGLADTFARPADLEALSDEGIDFTFDFILNHASVLSPQFQDILRRGERSKFADFFIDWNKFWTGHGAVSYTHLDVYKRQVLVSGLGLFFLSSVGAALAPSIAFMIAARVVAGIGASMRFFSIVSSSPRRSQIRSRTTSSSRRSVSVSYTHLDVYKRQIQSFISHITK